ncbi:hypothetical protein EDB19DRAFT_1752619 [Suillus lakei]|nr:hypothetical protein EDB19DRAFT_1752619 [Suillus lakei]
MATLPEEVTFIWRRPKALSAMLFFLNRYIALVGNIFGLFRDFLPLSNESCSRSMQARQLILIFQQIIICLILTLRTYALYGRSRRLLKWMLIVGLVLAGVGVAGSFGQGSSSVSDIQGSCLEIYTAETAVRHGLAWIAMFVFELLVFVLTVFRTCKVRGLQRFSLMSRKNIRDIIFQDGIMYFAAMTLINLLNILTYLSGPDTTRGSLSTFTSCMSATLISRLMLNLHKSIDTGIFSTPALDNDPSIAVLTTRVNVQSAISSHHC